MSDPDPRDGSMASISVVPMPRAQQQIFDMIHMEWAEMPRIGVSEMLLRALKDRGIVQTRWANYAREWRRTPPSEA